MAHATPHPDDVTTGKTADGPPGKKKARRTRSGGYAQDWAAYNLAQTRERDEFRRLLYELCAGVETPRQDTGHPWSSWSDLIFAAVLKSYLGLPARRLECDLMDAHRLGFLTQVPHFNTQLRFLGQEALTPCLQRLVRETSLPLKEVESVFAADSTGLSTCRRRPWYNRHRGKFQMRRRWIKLHAICGVSTNVITWAEVTDSDASDNPVFKTLVRNTARHFQIAEVSADGGYHGAPNQREVILVGGVPYIAYKSNSTEYGHPKSTFWKRMLRLYRERSPEFTEHYNLRNNVESTFHMIKSKFGDRLTSKTDRAQINEALCVVLCHNLCVLVQSMFELGVSPTFWTPVTPLAAGAPAEATPRLTAVIANLPTKQSDSARTPATSARRQTLLFGPDGLAGVEEITPQVREESGGGPPTRPARRGTEQGQMF